MKDTENIIQKFRQKFKHSQFINYSAIELWLEEQIPLIQDKAAREERERMLIEKLEVLAYLNTAINLGNEIILALNDHLDFGTEDDPNDPEEIYLTGDFTITTMKVREKYKKELDALTSSKTMKEVVKKLNPKTQDSKLKLPCGCPKTDEYSMCINQGHLKQDSEAEEDVDCFCHCHQNYHAFSANEIDVCDTPQRRCRHCEAGGGGEE